MLASFLAIVAIYINKDMSPAGLNDWFRMHKNISLCLHTTKTIKHGLFGLLCKSVDHQARTGYPQDDEGNFAISLAIIRRIEFRKLGFRPPWIKGFADDLRIFTDCLIYILKGLNTMALAL